MCPHTTVSSYYYTCVLTLVHTAAPVGSVRSSMSMTYASSMRDGCMTYAFTAAPVGSVLLGGADFIRRCPLGLNSALIAP